MKKNYVLEDVLNKFMQIHSFNIVDKKIIPTDSIVHETLDDIIQQVENCANNDITTYNNITESNQNLIKREQSRLKQQRYREKIISEQGIEVLRAKETEKKRNQRNKNIVTNTNKKTDEEKREEARLKKQRQRAELKERYCDEEYKKMRATELAAYRKNKQED
jgi:GTP:adenosylcobinamide-phosphate guanylyltransferase